MPKTLSVLLLTFLLAPCWAQERLIEGHLLTGELESARQLVVGRLSERPGSSELRLQLGLVQVLQALETYSQGMHRLGLRESLLGQVPFLRLPVPPNPDPEPATNASVRAQLDRLSRDLGQAQLTLARIPDSWSGRVPLKLGRVRIDLDGDGLATEGEELWRVVDALNPSLALTSEQAHAFGLHLDAGDVRWLEGYCHLLRGLLDVALAYDTQKVFEHTGHLFFRRTDSAYPFLAPRRDGSGDDDSFILGLLDSITLVHLLDLPLIEPARMTSALDHFRETIGLSRRSWTCVLAETDNQYEWIPNPRQTSVIPDWKVSEQMVAAWLEFLGEAQSILAGATLVPFWRDVPATHGVNLANVFLHPRDFDLVLWLQGPGAAPYLETGKVSSTEFWRLLNRAFDGQFLGFALWFN